MAISCSQTTISIIKRNADLGCIIEKIEGYKYNPETSSTTEVSEHIQSGFSMPAIFLFRSIENKHDIYSGKDFMKKFCDSLREHPMKIINFKKKKWSYYQKISKNHIKMQKFVIFVKKNLKTNIWKIKNTVKLDIISLVRGV